MSHTANLKPKIVISSAVLSVRKVRVTSQVMSQHEHAMVRMGRAALYPYQHKVIVPYNITSGTQLFVQENVFRGRTPKMLVLAMVGSDAYVGSYTKNPYNFSHFGVNYVSLKRDGESIPFQPFEPNFAKPDYWREYLNIFSACGMAGRDDILSFDFSEYPKGYCFLVFNLTPDVSNTSSMMQIDEQSNLRIELKFGTALAANVTLLVLGVFDGMLEVDADRNVYCGEI